MSGTNHSKPRLRQLSRLSPLLRRRVAGFVLAVSVGALIIGYIDASVWRQVKRLEADFAAVKTERFYHGVQIRTAIRQLNDELFRFHLKGEPADLNRFQLDAAALKTWIESRRSEAATTEETAAFREIEAAFATYLLETSTPEMQKRPGISFDRQTLLDQISQKLRQSSTPVLDLTDRLVQVQRQSFGAFLTESQSTLDSLQYLIVGSFGILLALAVLVVALVYRGMITPLQTQLSQSHAAIERHEKLAALGGLAAGVAHEIRNPLTAIKFRLFSLKKSLPVAMADNEDTTVIADEINRLERIVKDFLQFARPSDPELVNLPALRLIEQVLALFKSPLDKAAIQARIESADDVWVRADPQQLKQVLINLIHNAAESIGRDGIITLRAVGVQDYISGERRAVTIISVTDTGKGMPKEVQKRLFDPFFTTKDGGTGLGLPIAARIVEKHGGELRYETELNQGTTFKVVLPRVTENES